MKKAEEYLSKYDCEPGEVALYGDKVIELIRQAQVDAINEAVKICAEEATTMYNYEFSMIDIDKHSILQVADKLKKAI